MGHMHGRAQYDTLRGGPLAQFDMFTAVNYT